MSITALALRCTSWGIAILSVFQSTPKPATCTGEVGPDAGGRRDGRGPAGYDEINQARGAGNFAAFIANNRAYNRYDFGEKKSLEAFAPAKPINQSPNNTGINELPLPNQLSFITPIFRLCVGRHLTPVADARRWPVRSTTLTKISIRLTSCQKNSIIHFSSMNGHATGSST